MIQKGFCGAMRYLPIIFFLCTTLSIAAKSSPSFLAKRALNEINTVKKLLMTHGLFYAYSVSDIIPIFLQELRKFKLGSYDDKTARKRIFTTIAIATCKELYIKYLWYARNKCLAILSHIILQNFDILLDKRRRYMSSDELLTLVALKNLLPIALMTAQKMRHNVL